MNEMARFSVIKVPFYGQSRASRLTWAQQSMWSCIQWLGEDSYYFNLARVLPVPESCTNDDVARAVALVVGRHEVLRTRFILCDGEPRQEVSASGTFSLRVFNVDQSAHPDHGTPRERIDFVVAALRSLPFDYAGEWPLRCALLAEQGAPRYLGLVFSHLAADGSGVEVCTRDLAEALANPRRLVDADEAGAGVWQPVDQAQREEGPYGRRASARAADRWRAQLAQVPVPLFPDCRQPAAEPRVWRIALESQAAATAGLLVARRAKTSFATVMLAASVAMLGAFTGNSRIALVLTAGNRFDEQTRSSVAMMAQDALMTLSLDEAAFPEIIQRVSSASLRAYFSGHYDPAVIKQVRAEVAEGRGIANIDISAYFNYISTSPDWAQTVPQDLTRATMEELKCRSKPMTISAWPRQDSTLFIHSFYESGRSIMHAVTDTAVFPLAKARAFLRAVEELVTRAVFGTVDAAEISVIASQQQAIEESTPAVVADCGPTGAEFDAGAS
jgi:hypothetical protein